MVCSSISSDLNVSANFVCTKYIISGKMKPNPSGTDRRIDVKKAAALLAAFTLIGCLTWTLKFDTQFSGPMFTIKEMWINKISSSTTTSTPTVLPRVKKIIDFRLLDQYFNRKEKQCDKILEGKRALLPFEFNYHNKFFERTLSELSSFHKIPLPEIKTVTRYIIYRLAHQRFVQTICDANFGIGRRALVILSTIQLPTMLYSFDRMGGFPFTFRMFPYLMNKFKRHFRAVRNKDEENNFLQQERRCDLLVLGGTSNAREAAVQMQLGKEIASYMGHVLIWELTKESNPVWDTALKVHKVRQHFRCSFAKDGQTGFAIGEYLSPVTTTVASTHSGSTTVTNIRKTVSKHE